MEEPIDIFGKIQPLVQKEIADMFAKRQKKDSYDVGVTPYHVHNGTDSPLIDPVNLGSSSSVTTYGGYVNGGGSAGTPFPSGWTSTRTGLGAYTVTHNLGTTNYVLVATAAGAVFGVCSVYAINSNDFHLSIVSMAASLQDTDFTFVLQKQS